MRLYSPLLATCALTALSLAMPQLAAPAHADQAAAQRIFKQAGLTPLKSCLDLSEPAKLDARRDAWLAAIKTLRAQSPAYVRGWLVGAEPPPRAVIDESRHQLQCMLSRMVDAAADPSDPLILNHLSQQESPTKAEMATLAALYRKQPSTRNMLLRRVIASHHRDANSQAIIWHRKHNFYGNSFNLISQEAAKKCKLPVGQAWKPDSKSHRECWLKTLSIEERQQEILNASSAPGISRHHWGTEFDIFSLNPRKFHKGQPMYDEYSWMIKHASASGFFKPFAGHDALGAHTYIEERWHWSYYPIAQAMTELIRAHIEDFEQALAAQWDAFEHRWNGKDNSTPYFAYIRKHWRDYVFNIAPLRAAH
jgi:LAS superfamily LD-carboxypeptidase LdcB